MNVASGARAQRKNGLWYREILQYPTTGSRVWYLVLVVAATIVLYYQFYVLGSVAPLVMVHLKMSLNNYAYVWVAANALGAVSSIFGGISDKVGRANLTVYGLIISCVVTLLLAVVNSLALFWFLFCVLGFVEGLILVATPTLVRDFSPQMGRGTAMAFWTIGPVAGSLVATFVANATLGSLQTWQSQYVIAGIVGLVVSLFCLFGLRELSPELRSQIMTSLSERALVEARARGIDLEAAMKNPYRQMVRPAIVLSALGVSIMLLMYYTSVGYLPIYLNAVFHFSIQQANGMMSIYWLVNIGTILVFGFLSDRLRVRKPFMFVGALLGIVAEFIFMSRVGHPTSASLMVFIMCLMPLCTGAAYVTWMAGYTESVEEINPALVATGVAVWASLLRWVVVAQGLIIPHFVTTLSGWLSWWWICAAGIAVFIPTIFSLRGFWSTRRAKEHQAQHEALVQAELARMSDVEVPV